MEKHNCKIDICDGTVHPELSNKTLCEYTSGLSLNLIGASILDKIEGRMKKST